MPNPADTVTPAVFYGWLVTALAWAGTICWNLLNRMHTNKVAADIRSDNFAFDEWNTIRTDIRTCVKAFEEEMLQICHATSSDIDELRQRIRDGHMRLVIRWDQLCRALRHADSHYHVEGCNWESLGSGIEQDNETIWDKITSTIENASSASSIELAKSLLLPIREWGEQIITPIFNAERSETLRHDPKKL